MRLNPIFKKYLNDLIEIARRWDAREESFYSQPDPDPLPGVPHFASVPPEVWAYQISGCQMCHKWLKDRAARPLSPAEVRALCCASPRWRERSRFRKRLTRSILGLTGF